MDLSREELEALNALTSAGKDVELAARMRAYRPEWLADKSDAELVREVRTGRLAANDLGLTDARMRARFIMIHVLIVPRFWTHPEAEKLMARPGGTPEVRFGDICATVKAALRDAGAGQECWW